MGSEFMEGLSRRFLYWTGRLHDLWILLAWAGILTGIMLNTFFHRSCVEYLNQLEFTNPCQSYLDLSFFLLAAIGAGMTIFDERLAVLGFLIVTLAASSFFFLVTLIPVFSGHADEVLSQQLIGRSVVITFRSVFPSPVFFSFVWSILGMYLGGKLELYRAPSTES